MKRSRALVAAVLLSVVAGCAGAVVASPTATPSPTATSSSLTRIEVTLRDSMVIEPAAMNVPVGTPVTFVVTNAGAVDHEFYLGDEQMQADHAAEMADMGGMMGHDEPNGIALSAGETKELSFTFETPGTWIAGCHVSGHYEAGMSATITITE